MNHLIELSVIGGYLVLLVAVGIAFRRFNAGVSDYFRLGGQGAWWMVGCSAFMTAFSAWTFTGAAGTAYEAGWSIQILFFANVFVFTIHAVLLGPWFRQLRAITAPEVIRMRFGETTQQTYAWLYAVLGLLYAAIWLVGLATFIATVFADQLSGPAEALGLNVVQFVIIITGAVVLVYSTSGGSWAVMATDVLQSVILIPLTIVVAALCLLEVGGVGEFFGKICEAELEETFAVVNAPGTFENDPGEAKYWEYTWLFVISYMMYKTVAFSTIEVSQRYFGVKNGLEARFAALLAGGMMVCGMMVWFVPPIVSRLLFSADVEAMTALDKPAESAYAVAALNVLPAGLVGLMTVAMLSATMSSMDSGLNKNAGVFVRDIVPFFRKLLKRDEFTERTSFIIAQITTGVLGIIITLIALHIASQDEGRGVFGAMLNVGALLSLPLAVPMTWALFVRRAPWWSALVSVGAALLPSVIAFGSGEGWWGDGAWPYHQKIFWNVGMGSAAFLATIPFWSTATAQYRTQVQEFFTRMHTPIDPSEHVGPPRGREQLRVVGVFALIIAFLIGCLVFVPGNDLPGRLAILFVSAFIGVIGGLMMVFGLRAAREQAQNDQISRSE